MQHQFAVRVKHPGPRPPLDPSALTTVEFNGVLASLKQKVQAGKANAKIKSTADLTIGDLIKGIKPAQLWGVLGAIPLWSSARLPWVKSSRDNAGDAYKVDRHARPIGRLRRPTVRRSSRR